MAWIQFSGLLGNLYKGSLLKVIGELVGRIIKIDGNTKSESRGQFAWMAMCIDLKFILRINCESLLNICYCCRCYGHMKEVCPKNKDWVVPDEVVEIEKEKPINVAKKIEDKDFESTTMDK